MKSKLIKSICLLAAALGIATPAIAGGTPSNDTCAGAFFIITLPFSEVVDGAPYTNDATPCTVSAIGARRGFWYRWVAPFNGKATFTNNNQTGGQSNISVFSGTCAALSQVACAESVFGSGFSSATFFPTQGTTYFILAGGNFPFSELDDTYAVSLTLVAPDECANAFPLTCGATIQANLFGATSNPADPAFSCRLPTAGRGVNTLWYSFVAPSNRAVLTTGIVSGGSANDTLLAIYSGTCGSLTQIGCSDDIGGGNFLSHVTLTSLTPGQTYLVQLAGYDTSEIGTYSLNLDCTPDYEECATAPTIACNAALDLDLTLTTTNPADPIFPCRMNPPPGPPVPGVNTAWARFTAESPNLRLSVLATDGSPNQNTLLAAYIGTGCGSLSLFNCNDNVDSTGLSRMNITTEVGREFWIQVAANSAADVRKYRLLLECNPDCATCPSGAVVEKEPCGTDQNGVCTIGQSVSCAGANICGTLTRTAAGNDLDFYAFSLDGVTNVNFCVVSPQRVEFAITSNPFCDTGPTPIIYAGDSNQDCEAGCISATLLPGAYFIAVGLQDINASCGAANNYTGTFSTSIYCPGDFNSDNRIDTADLVRFLGQFGQAQMSDCSQFDLIRNGQIDTADLVRFLGRFGGLCLPPPLP